MIVEMSAIIAVKPCVHNHVETRVTKDVAHLVVQGALHFALLNVRDRVKRQIPVTIQDVTIVVMEHVRRHALANVQVVVLVVVRMVVLALAKMGAGKLVTHYAPTTRDDIHTSIRLASIKSCHIKQLHSLSLRIAS